MEAFLTPAFFSLIGGVIGAGLTAWFSFRRFYSEKWWDKKFEAYNNVLDALNSLRDDLEKRIEEEVGGPKISEEVEKALTDAYNSGRKEIERQRAIGGLVLGDKVVIALKKLERDLSEASGGESYFDHIDASLFAVNSAINSVVSHGRSELRSRKF